MTASSTTLGLPMGRTGSGTAWQPDSTPMPGVHWRPGAGWDVLAAALRVSLAEMFSGVGGSAKGGASPLRPLTEYLERQELDILVLVEEPTFPGCHVRARPIGVMRMRDEKGPDDKIIAVPSGDPHFAHVSELGDVSSHWQLEIEFFFRTYKLLEQLETEILGWDSAGAAREIIDAARDEFRRGAPNRPPT